EGDAQRRSKIRNFCRVNEPVLWIGQDVRDLNSLPLQQRAASGRASSDRNWVTFHVFSVLTPVPVAGGKLKDLAHRPEQVGHIRPAQARRGFDQRVEYGL